jgi:tetratricopeptide (TPR) repeat protein
MGRGFLAALCLILLLLPPEISASPQSARMDNVSASARSDATPGTEGLERAEHPGQVVGGRKEARISEGLRTLPTYPFSEPNPVPILVRDRRLYPYHSFEGYSADAEPREWTVVTLENDYIQVFVLPEVGGKVWGAVVKETGHEFIYRNEVMKFRNIALRGPWTSGGIEFNFGVIGHTPSTATPVDHLLRENPDGSVSCIVGAMDLPSRTQWRVEIRLPADRAYFETRVLWYNPTPLQQPYYNWMTAAAFARGDLEMSMPGNAYLQHSGQVRTWPVDEEGRYLPLYANNAFDGHKSYHVVGELHDFFGGYYRDEDYGFGHWARYEEMPGQKLWLWALSREGGVWEDLLTDTDGQYVEFQAGRLFVQYSPGSQVNPITQVGFDPLSADRWVETWFPLEGIGGLSDASRDGAMHVSLENGRLTIGVNAFRTLSDTLRVWSGDRLVALEGIELAPLEPFHRTLGVGPGEPFRVSLPALGLEYGSDPSGLLLSRPFATDPDAWPSIPEVEQKVFQARELMKAREYPPARELYEAAMAQEPWNPEALLGLGELAYRMGTFESGLEHVDRVLQLDAYDAEANFMAGVLYRALGRIADARDAFGWAARSMAYRSAAHAQLAEIMMGRGDWDEAARYARLALDYDRHSVPGWRAMAVIGRKTGNVRMAENALGELLEIDPLDHFARAEEYLGTLDPPYGRPTDGNGTETDRGSAPPPTGSAQAAVQSPGEALGGEFPEQSLLELVVQYAKLGMKDDALALLEVHPAGRPDLVLRAWRAWLRGDPALLDGPVDPAFSFPYRTETVPVLDWATRNGGHWVWRYLLALNLWAVGQDQEAASAMEALEQVPDFGPFYVARARLSSELRGASPGPDLRRAVSLDPKNRTLHIYLIRFLQGSGAWSEALEALGLARTRFPGDFNLDLLQARTLINLGRAPEAAAVLESTRVLPSENSGESHRLYEQAHTLSALDALDAGDPQGARRHLQAALEWPESLGQGRPYEPEERLVRFLLGRVGGLLGDEGEAARSFRAVLEATGSLATRPTPWVRAELGGLLDVLALPSLRALGRTAELEAIARYTSANTDVGRFAVRLAGALAWGTEAPWEAAHRVAEEFPFLFADLEGAMLLRALTVEGNIGSGVRAESGGTP